MQEIPEYVFDSDYEQELCESCDEPVSECQCYYGHGGNPELCSFGGNYASGVEECEFCPSREFCEELWVEDLRCWRIRVFLDYRDFLYWPGSIGWRLYYRFKQQHPAVAKCESLVEVLLNTVPNRLVLLMGS